MQAQVAIKVIKADAYKEYRDLIEREIMVRGVRGTPGAADVEGPNRSSQGQGAMQATEGWRAAYSQLPGSPQDQTSGPCSTQQPFFHSLLIQFQWRGLA